MPSTLATSALLRWPAWTSSLAVPILSRGSLRWIRHCLSARPRAHPASRLRGLPVMRIIAILRRQSVQHDVGDAAFETVRHFLRQERDLGPGRHGALAMIGLRLAPENPHQRRLAGPVPPQQADLLARLTRAGH